MTEFWATDTDGGNADPRDRAGGGNRLYYYGVPETKIQDYELVPRTQRIRSVHGVDLRNSTQTSAAPLIIRTATLSYSDPYNDVDSVWNESLFYSDAQPVVEPNVEGGDDAVTVPEYSNLFSFVSSNIVQKAGFTFSVSNIDGFFRMNHLMQRFPSQLLSCLGANAVTGRVRRSISTAVRSTAAPFSDSNYIHFRLVLQWKCMANDGDRARWIHAFESGTGFSIDSGEFAVLNSQAAWKEAWSRLMANASEFYDFGADVPWAGSPSEKHVIDVVRGPDNEPVGLRINRQVGDILQSQFVCAVTVEIIKPANFNPNALYGSQTFACYSKPCTVKEKALDLFLSKKQSVVMMKNSDNACFARCLVLLLTKAYCIEVQGKTNGFTEKQGSTRISLATMRILDEVFQSCGDICRRYRHIGDTFEQVAGHQKIQKILAQALCTFVGHDFDTPVDVQAIALFSEKLQCTVRVLDSDCNFNKAYNIGNFSSVLYVCRVGAHFHPVRSFRGLKGHTYECVDCDVAFSGFEGHRSCPLRCFHCHGRPCPGMGPYDDAPKKRVWVKCESCHRAFPNALCFENHKEKVCAKWMTCGMFGCKPFKRTAYESLSQHTCGDTECMNCKQMCIQSKHRCAMQQKSPKAPIEDMVFFDFECCQETGVHTVTHCVARVGSSTEDVLFKPSSSGDISAVLSEFCGWLFSGSFKGFTVIAHNGQGYDFHFIVKWCLDRNMRPTKVIRTGQKVKHMVIDGVRFVDSLCFLLMPLSGMPKTFGFEEKAKGYFPHMFNTRENQGYVGEIPSRDYYTPNEMTKSSQAAFNKWYADQTGVMFDFQAEIIKYCVSDVDILQTACLAFQKLYYAITGVDPMSYMTIAGACLAVFRSRFYDGESIMTMLPEDAKFVRRGFFGGRTCVMQASVKAGEGESIRYVDVTSLYPWVNTFCEYPMGDYVRDVYSTPVTDVFEQEVLLDSTFGFLEVDLECPTDLLLPLLPEKRGHALMFDLLPKRKYVVSSVELSKAISLGYKVTCIYSRIHWERKTTDLFRSYMLTFLKVKQEASGWSGKSLHGKQVETLDEKRAWIDLYEQEEGIRLEEDKVVFNPGLRAISKLCLNSLWGKTGQRPEHKQVLYTTEADKVLSLLERYKVFEVTDVGVKDMHEVVYSTGKEESLPSFNTCVALAAFTTSHARLKLYSGLEMLGERAIYCDTDSIVYVAKAGEPDIPIGDKLGEWTDECGGDYIQEFVATGPKSYAYKTLSGKVVVKCKGFKMSTSNCEATLNFNNFQAAVGGEEYSGDTSTAFKIVRDKGSKSIVTEKDQHKSFQPTLGRKGIVDDSSSTVRILPFGYNKI